MPDPSALADAARDRAPSRLLTVVENTSRHNTMTLAAGLAFFGLLSFGPAVALGFGLLRVVASGDATETLVNVLQGAFPEQLGLGDLLEQMEDNGAQYAGIGLLVLLWPATTLASGWTRALDDIFEVDSDGGVRGLQGRLRGLAPGGILVAALFLLFAAVTFGAAVLGGGGEGQIALVVAIGLGAVALQFLFNLVIFRMLPSDKHPWSELWPGAVWSTLGVVTATVGFGLALSFGEGLADQYPPSLTTSIFLGLWLYAANTALLLGGEYNAARLGVTDG
jgi:membrane protein